MLLSHSEVVFSRICYKYRWYGFSVTGGGKSKFAHMFHCIVRPPPHEVIAATDRKLISLIP